MSKLVLIADDIEDILTLVSFCLEGAGYEVVKARDGEQALALAQEHQPVLAILDLMMPKLDGYEVTRAIRADERTRQLPVMLLSAHAHEEDVRRGFEAGADDYLRKPFRPHELLALVEAMVGRNDSASRENGAAPGKDRAA